MTAHRPSTAALLNPAHATFRPGASGCVVTGGVLDELTPSERAEFVAAVEALANGVFTRIVIDPDPIHSASPVDPESRPGGSNVPSRPVVSGHTAGREATISGRSLKPAVA